MTPPTTIAEAVALAAERDALVAKLDARWAWCEANSTHPKHDEREAAVLVDLATYEAMEIALIAAAATLLGAVA